ncbi:NAD(+) diphosphatase [Microbacterium sp. NPDC057407]|uniref:NAD(+) diphosphatase n=1 Tax=Microbacterium sp. NPDC057407 TaxID=3346120 RepID=UPI00366D21B5
MTAPGSTPFRHVADSGVDRAAGERSDPDLLARARVDESSRVLVLSGDRAPLVTPERLSWVAAERVPDGAEWAFLGRDGGGRALLAAAFEAGETDPFEAPAGWGALRAVGGTLDAPDAEAFVEALSLARWLLDSSFCPACGALTMVVDAGWSRRCPSCGRQHFPRTDPAVIVAITSAADPDVLLLGSNALWGENRFSCFAGFVEAGESLESAVRREVAEESGIDVVDVQYRGSQAWPYRRSLMLGFIATAADDASARADGDEIAAVRWFTRDEIGAGLAGEGDLRLPGPASIAHRLIRDWHGGAS